MNKHTQTMPTINRPPKKANNNRPKGESAQHIAEMVYNTPMWKNIRKSMLMCHPLCQNCLRELATEVHHVKPLSSAKDDAELLELGFSTGNLMTLCETCHHDIHNSMKKNLKKPKK